MMMRTHWIWCWLGMFEHGYLVMPAAKTGVPEYTYCLRCGRSYR